MPASASPPTCRSSTRTSTTATTRGSRCRRRTPIAILRKAGVKRALVSSSGDDGTQRLLAEAPDLIVPSLRPYRSRGEIGDLGARRDRGPVPRGAAARSTATSRSASSTSTAPTPTCRCRGAWSSSRSKHEPGAARALRRRRHRAAVPAVPARRASCGRTRASSGPAKVREMLRKHTNLWCDLAFRSDHGVGGKVRAGVARAVPRVPRPLHGRHRHLHARALALHRRARALVARLARRPAAGRGRAHRLEERRGVSSRACGPAKKARSDGSRARWPVVAAARRLRALAAQAATAPAGLRLRAPSRALPGRLPHRSGRASTSASTSRVDAVVCAKPGAAADRAARRRADARAPARHELPPDVSTAGRRALSRRGPAVPHAGRWEFVFDVGAPAAPSALTARRSSCDDAARGRSSRRSRRSRSAAAETRRASTRVESRRILRARAVAAAGAARSVATASPATPDAIALGERLFFDPRLSANGAVACASCHRPGARVDRRPRAAAGLGALDRNTPRLLERRPQRWFGWDGADDNLWARGCGRCSTRARWAASARAVARGRARRPGARVPLPSGVRRAPARDDERVLVDVAKALAAFQETLVIGPHALRRLPRRARARRRARRGALSARGAARAEDLRRRGAVQRLPLRPGFTNGEFHDIGIPFFVGPGRVDAGRHDGISACAASRSTCSARYNDDASRRQRRPGRATSTPSTATSASSRCRRCATSR